MEVGLALWAMGSQRQGQDREVPLAGSQGLPEFSAGASILQTLLLFPLCRPESEAQGGEITCTQVHRLSICWRQDSDPCLCVSQARALTRSQKCQQTHVVFSGLRQNRGK